MEKKKSLGQNFLHSAHYLALIADAAHIVEGERVLEVGPGDGALTRELLSRGAHVSAVEKDHRLIPLLRETFAREIASEQLQLIEGDALTLNLPIKDHVSYKIVANIPYYITGAFLEKYLSAPRQPSMMVLLVQKEVAERIAREKKESILSLSVKAFGTPHYIKTVPAGAFSPPPKVDSAILAVENISRNNFENGETEKKFFQLLHAGFAHKRKLLARNLEPLLGREYSNILQNIGISEKARAEDIPLEQWLALSKVDGLALAEHF